MSLFKPTPGEIVDRMSILELKIDNYRAKGIQPNGLAEELVLCQEALSKLAAQCLVAEGFAKCQAKVEALEHVNRTIWKLVDQIHSFDEPCLAAAKIGIRIYRENDLRSKLMGEINSMLGYGVEQKVYSA